MRAKNCFSIADTRAFFVLFSLIFAGTFFFYGHFAYAQTNLSGESQVASIGLKFEEIKKLFESIKNALSSSVASPQQAQVVPTIGLLGHWKFDEGSGTIAGDSSGNGRAGTLTNGPTWVSGSVGGALLLDGTNDYVDMGTGLDVSALPLTLSAWINPSNFNDYGTIIGKRTSYSTNGMRFNLDLNQGSGNVLLQSYASNLLFSYAPPLNTWTHITVVARTGGTDLYVNGTLNQTLGVFTLGSGGAAQLRIGNVPDGPDQFAGKIDEVTIHNRALTGTEVVSLAETTSLVPDTTAPSQPGGLTATAISSSQINLSWNTSTDNVGVTGYDIYRNGVQTASIANTSYNDTGLSASTTYVYTVSARDAAGNISTPSPSVSVTTQGVSTSAITGLDFPGSAGVVNTMRFKFDNPQNNGLPIYGPGGNGVTYIWQAYPRQQPGYYTAFFWGNDDGQENLNTFLWKNGGADSYYGAHPYPKNPPSGNIHDWEISIEQNDYVTGTVVYDRWYTQALRVWTAADGTKHHEFYWDLPNTDANHMVSRTSPASWGNTIPPSPALTWGDAPWNPGNEVWNGILRGIQIYSTNLSLTDIQNEINAPLSSSAGAGAVWYLNTNPTPTDISDKSGKGHHPVWVGNERSALYTSGITPPPTAAPTVTLTATPTSVSSGGSSTLTWSSTNATSCTASGSWSGTKATSGSQTLTNLTTTGTYTLSCTGSGGTSSQSVTINITTAVDTTPPSAPTNLTATAVSSSQINLSWNASTDNVGVTGYDIYRNGTLLTTVTGTSYSNIGLTASTLYSYHIRAKDAAGNSSVQSSTASATTQTGGTSTNPIDNLKPGEWYRVPNSNLRSVAYQWPAGVTYTRNGMDVSSVMDVWNGGAYDSKRDKLIVWGGGHFAYGGNEIYAFDVNTLKWERVTDPSIPVAENTSYASDGNPVARHTYNTLQYVASIDRFCAMSANSYFSQSGVGSQTDCFDFNSKKWEKKANSPGSGYGTYSVYDSVSGNAFLKGASAGCYLSEWNPVANTWTQRSGQSGCYDIYYTAALDSVRRNMVEVGGGGINVWNLSTSGNTSRTPISSSGPQNIVSASNPGFEYDPASDRFVGWNGGADVYTLNPVTWAWARVSPASTNTIIPTQPNSSYTFGRFRYIPSKNAFIVVNSVDEDVYIYKLTSGSGITPPPTAAPTVTLTATPTSVSSGGSSTLTWSSTNATSCTASGSWSGTKATSGSQTLTNLTTTGTYTLSCTGSGGTSSQSVTITVTTTPPPPPPSTKFSLNDRVQVSSGPLNVRATASASGTLLGSQATGNLGTIIGGPIAADGFNWWNVNYDNAPDGWSAEDYLAIYTTMPPSGSGQDMSSLQDEKNTYIKWGWTWPTSAEPSAVTERVSGYSITSPDIHGDTEGDDLWTYLMMYKRTGNTVYLNRAQKWADYFKNRYRTSAEFTFDKSYLLDHLYGWGLIDWYEYTCTAGTCDTAALTEAENIGIEVEGYWNTKGAPGTVSIGEYSLRQGARHLRLATRLAEVTGKQRWINLRDKLIDHWLQTPDWDSRGMYFMGPWYTNEDLATDPNCKYTGASTCPYQQGDRIVPSFHITMLMEAFDNAYRTTGRIELKNRMIAMSRFVDQYGIDSRYQYSGKTFGIVKGQPWHSYSASCGTSCTFWDPVYTTSLVNTLVYGYKYTGDNTLLDGAKYFFNRGTKGVYGSPTARETSDTSVGHFVDTLFSSSSGFIYLDNNKGELQYTYRIFENGGNPTIVGTTPSPTPTVSLSASPTSVTSGGSSTLTWSSTNATSCTASGSWSGTKATSGSQVLTNLTTTGTYTLSCTGSGGTSSQSVTINITTAVDTTPPSAPTNLTATAVSSSQINLSWNASTDNVGTTGYRVERCTGTTCTAFTQIATPGNTAYNNTLLSSNTTYRYRVRAADAAGNLSSYSSIVSGTTQSPPDTTLPTITITSPTSATTYTATTNSVTLGGTATDNVGVTAVTWSNSTGGSGTASGTTNWSASIPLASGTNTITVGARDAAGNIGTDTLAVTYTPVVLDTTLPVVSMTAPANGAVLSGTVTLSANATDNVGITGVQFRLDGVDIGTEDATSPYTTPWNSTTAGNGTHTLSARARDAAGNQSIASLTVTVSNITPDTTAPSAPTNLTATAVSSSQIALAWNPSVDPTVAGQVTSGLAGYRVYRGTTQIATTTLTSYNNTNLSPSTSYTYRVEAYDTAGNRSAQSASASATTQAPPVTADTTAPNITAVSAANITQSSATISWATNEGATSRVSYGTNANALNLQANDTAFLTSHGISLSSLTRRTTYSYRVSSTDASGNTATSSTLSFTTVSGKPGKVKNLKATAGSVILSWETPNNDFINEVKLYRSTGGYPTNTDASSLFATLPAGATSFTDTTTGAAITYYYTVYTVDDLGVSSDPEQIAFTTAGGQGSSGGGGGGGVATTPSTGSTGSTTTSGTTGTGGGQTTTQAGTTTTPPTGGTTLSTEILPTLAGPFSIGMRSEQVKLLQQMLAKDGVFQGEATGYYGPVTQKAVQDFQAKYGIVTGGTPSTTGYGLAGPGTRTKLNALYAGTSSGGSSSTLTDPQRQALIAQLQKQVQDLMKILAELTAKLQVELAKRGLTN